MEVCNLMVYLKDGLVVFPIFPMIPLQMQANRGWGWTGIDRNSTSSTSTVSCRRPIDTSPANSLRSPVCSSVIQIHIRDEFLHRRRLQQLWPLYNFSSDGHSRLIVRDNTWFCGRNQHGDFLLSNPDHPVAQ